MIYYLKAKNRQGQDVILKIRVRRSKFRTEVHQGNIDYVEEITEDEMQKEIRDGKTQ